MTKREEYSGPQMNAVSEKEIETECSDLQDILKSFHDTHHNAADRSVFYWKGRHEAIMKKIRAPVLYSNFRRPFLWIPAAAALLFCLFYFLPERRLPVPDIAAGYDQQLLIEVERALSRNYPAALESIDILARELEQ